MDRAETFQICAGQRVLVLSPTPTHPQDYGNRKRVFEVCKRFKDQGAQITFAHYPSELEWRGTLPVSAERAMQQCWDHYYTIAPTRALHADPIASDHRIDEWFDPAIGQFLNWLFSVRSFDIVIVNYAWLSNAFDFVPPQTFKILDTHDKVSGRRKMLTSLGLGPEFFHTTEDQEAIALDRADLVWAIKDEERDLFAKMSATPVLTMPHLDPMRATQRLAPDESGYLRVGVIGARNNVNRMNISEFLRVALPVFEQTFAPIRIVVAGTVCELLEDVESPLVELRGPLESVDDFYGAVDCVAVPMRASTGLKIKAGEAISRGVPLLSLAHAFEGYEPSDPLQTLDDFQALARALADLSFEPSERLEQLAKASVESYAKTQQKISTSFQETIRLGREAARSIVLVVDSRAFVTDSIFNLVVKSVYGDLRWLGTVTLLVAQGSAKDIADYPLAIEWFSQVVIAGDLADLDVYREKLARPRMEFVGIKDWLEEVRPKILILDVLHPDLSQTDMSQTIVLMRPGMIAFSLGHSEFPTVQLKCKEAFVAAPGPSLQGVALASRLGAAPLLSPAFRHSPAARARPPELVQGRKTLAILGSPGSNAVAMAAAMARAWGLEPFVVCSFEDIAENTTSDVSIPPVKVDDYVAALCTSRSSRPHFAVDFSAGRFGLLLCREVLERLRVPMVTGSSVGRNASLPFAASEFKAGSENELWATIRGFATGEDAERAEVFCLGWKDLEWGNGWSWFWRYAKRLFETAKMPRASLS